MKSMLLRMNAGIRADGHLKSILQGSSVTLGLKVCGSLASYIFTLLVTRSYGADAMGTFALAITVITICSVIGRLGLDTALLKLVSEYSSKGKWGLVSGIYLTSLKIVLPVSLLLSMLLFFGAPYAAEYIFHKTGLTPFLRLGSIGIVPTVLMYINSESLRGLKAIKEYAFIQHAGVFILGVFCLGTMLLWGQDLRLPLFSYLAALLIVAFISTVLILRRSNITTYGITEAPAYRQLFDISLPMLLSSSMFLIMGWTDTVMLGIFKTEKEVGIYNVALKISAITSLTLMAINSVSAPKFAEMYGKGKMDELSKVVRHSTKLIFWTSLPVLVTVGLFPSVILGIFGDEFRVGVYALLILTLGQFVNAISGSVGYILQMTGHEKLFRNIIMCAAGINIALNFLLIPKYGVNGAAFSSMVSMIFWNLVSALSIKKILKLNTIFC